MGAHKGRSLLLSCVMLLAVAAGAFSQQSSCQKGDKPCFCKAIGGTWKALQAPLLPACKVSYQHQGEQLENP
jgi:hypothetical protein